MGSSQDEQDRPSLSAFLDEAEMRVVGICLRVVLEGPWLARELHIRTGLNADEVAAVARAWPGGPGTPVQTQAVAGALLEVGSGIRFTEAEWDEWVGVPRAEVKKLFRKVRALEQDGVIPS